MKLLVSTIRNCVSNMAVVAERIFGGAIGLIVSSLVILMWFCGIDGTMRAFWPTGIIVTFIVTIGDDAVRVQW